MSSNFPRLERLNNAISEQETLMIEPPVQLEKKAETEREVKQGEIAVYFWKLLLLVRSGVCRVPQQLVM